MVKNTTAYVCSRTCQCKDFMNKVVGNVNIIKYHQEGGRGTHLDVGLETCHAL